MAFTLSRSASSLAQLVANTVAPQSIRPGGEREKVKSLLIRYQKYLEANAIQHHALGEAIESMQSAVAAFLADSSADPWAPLVAVDQEIAKARTLDPSIPEP